MNQLTTHILDTSIGKPAAGIKVKLEKSTGKSWTFLAEGIANTDGRIGDLLKTDSILEPGYYKLQFDTASYFEKQKIKCFYPSVEIIFEISDALHYHVPLLLNPYGYSTYRGS